METEKMQEPECRGDGSEDPQTFCREIVQMVQTLKPTETLCIYFMKWKTREEVIAILESRYKEADLRRIELGIYH